MRNPIHVRVEFDEPVGPEAICEILDHLYHSHITALAACMTVTDALKEQLWGDRSRISPDSLQVQKSEFGAYEWFHQKDVEFLLSPLCDWPWRCDVSAGRQGAAVSLRSRHQFPVQSINSDFPDEEALLDIATALIPTFRHRDLVKQRLGDYGICADDIFGVIDSFFRMFSETVFREDMPEWQLHRKILAVMIMELASLYGCSRASIYADGCGEYHLFPVPIRQ